jgi:site-specific DNA recombinase
VHRQGHFNPTILEGLSETETRLATLQAEAATDAGNVVQIPRDIVALYRAHVDALAETLSGGDVVGRASDQLHELIEQITVTWDEDARAHHLDLTGDLVLLLSAGDNKKAAGLSSAACSLRLVAGIGFEPMTFRL